MRAAGYALALVVAWTALSAACAAWDHEYDHPRLVWTR